MSLTLAAVRFRPVDVTATSGIEAWHRELRDSGFANTKLEGTTTYENNTDAVWLVERSSCAHTRDCYSAHTRIRPG